jgi:hypothetical protein
VGPDWRRGDSKSGTPRYKRGPGEDGNVSRRRAICSRYVVAQEGGVVERACRACRWRCCFDCDGRVHAPCIRSSCWQRSDCGISKRLRSLGCGPCCKTAGPRTAIADLVRFALPSMVLATIRCFRSQAAADGRHLAANRPGPALMSRTPSWRGKLPVWTTRRNVGQWRNVQRPGCGRSREARP